MASDGVNYPGGYRESLIQKYKRYKILYPRILMRMGEPNIRKHSHYHEILHREERFLDYGCGTGDDIRALVNDGYPRRNIVGYDVNWCSINLGFDLYLDRGTFEYLFVVSKKFPFKSSTFGIVYSGSVIHVLANKRTVKRYVSTAYKTLNQGGIFFGSTRGLRKEPLKSVGKELKRNIWHMRINLLSKEELHDLLCETGFSNIEVSEEQQEDKVRLWFYAKK
ncbi:MAG: class I SAM-dependent methyltransferase [Candidatus Freyarchaeum deiterrae]